MKKALKDFRVYDQGMGGNGTELATQERNEKPLAPQLPAREHLSNLLNRHKEMLVGLEVLEARVNGPKPSSGEKSANPGNTTIDGLLSELTEITVIQERTLEKLYHGFVG